MIGGKSSFKYCGISHLLSFQHEYFMMSLLENEKNGSQVDEKKCDPISRNR